MAHQTNIVRVPKPPKTAFNPHRPLAGNTLLLNQVKHFHDLEMKLAPAHRTGVDFAAIQTEGQAADYIRRMTAILHPQPAKAGGR